MKNLKFYIAFGVIMLTIFGLKYFDNNKQEIIQDLLFTYPSGNIDFAGEVVPMAGNNIYNKDKFDKEFLITGNTLYQFYLYVKRYPLFIPYIEQKLKENNIPDDFKYLAIAESALLNDALSTAGAKGIWQFMPDTAKRFKLRVDDDIDERLNFEKSTDASIEYFKVLYKKFGNRTLVAAAYNRGENGIARDLESQKVKSYYDLYLNAETGRYVFRILGIKYTMIEYFNKKELFDKVIGDPYSIPKTKIVKVGKIDNLVDWAIKNGTTLNEIKILNQWILGDNLPEGKWEIKIME